MNVYLIDKETKQLKQTYSNVTFWNYYSVEFLDGDCRSKIYCDLNTEYFTDVFEGNAEE